MVMLGGQEGGIAIAKRGPRQTEQDACRAAVAPYDKSARISPMPRAELVAVAGETGRDDHVRCSGSTSMMKCSSGEFTNMQVLKPTGGPSAAEVALEPGKSFVFRNDAPVDGVGIDRFVAMMEFADLEAFVSPFRKPVEYPVSGQSRMNTGNTVGANCGPPI